MGSPLNPILHPFKPLCRNGRLRLPEAIVTRTDAQEFTINRTSRLERRNVVLSSYAPYDPRMLGTYLTLFRTVHNFVTTGSDGRTPAMRLGIASEPLAFEDILWPGQPVPRPKQARRRGRKLALPTPAAGQAG